MNASDALEKLLRSYVRYYDIRREDVCPPFAAEAAFHSHEAQYFLVKRATIGESESHEYVFFATTDHLTLPLAQQYDEAAWTEGLSRVQPHKAHRSSDIILIILADRVDAEAAQYLKKLRRSKSYQHTLQGWSDYRVIALETASGALACNRRGRDLRKLLRNI